MQGENKSKGSGERHRITLEGERWLVEEDVGGDVVAIRVIVREWQVVI